MQKKNTRKRKGFKKSGHFPRVLCCIWLQGSLLHELKVKHDPDLVTELPHKNHGRPRVLPEQLDNTVQNYIKQLRLAGGIVNNSTVTAAAHGTVLNKNKTLLSEFGSSVDMTKNWALSVMRRMGLVYRMDINGARKLPADFDKKAPYHQRIREVVREHKIPDDLIINWDQTGCKFVPASEWTMTE